MHQRTAQDEVLGEVVFPVDAVHRLALHAVVGVRLQRYVDVRTGIDDTLVDDGHLAGIVVHRVVGTFLQRDTASRHHHRALRHVGGTQRNDVGTLALELTRHQELVLLGCLLGYGLRRVIQLVEHVLVGHVAQSGSLNLAAQVVAEGLCRGQEDAAVGDGVALHEVELPVGVRLHVVVQAVATQELQQRLRLQLLLGQVSQVDTRRIALVLDVEPELLLLHVSGQVVDVLHHQVPVTLRGTVRRILQRLDKQALLRIGNVTGKLTHLEGAATVGIFKGHGQHLVGLQTCPQRDIAQGLVHRVLRR